MMQEMHFLYNKTHVKISEKIQGKYSYGKLQIIAHVTSLCLVC